MWTLYIIGFALVMSLPLMITNVGAQTFGQSELVHEWTWLDFDWPSDADKEEATRDESYVPERSVIAGIKVYKNDTYLSIPRWFWTSGQPVTLAKVVEVEGQVKLRPYPTWAAQKQGDCTALQYVWSMEIDPNTGLMYVIDSGRVGMQLNLCPAKIVVYDLNTDQQVELHELPEDVVSSSRNFLNDLVLDYVDEEVRYAYITDANDGYLVRYDFLTRKAHKFDHWSMRTVNVNDSVINITGKIYNFPVPIDGIAMSPDFKHVYYSVLGGYELYQVPTSVLRKKTSLKSHVRVVGKKVSQSDGIVHGSRNIYFGAINRNAVYYWDVDYDMADQGLSINQVAMVTQTELVKDDEKMQWPDTFAFDNHGWLWFVSNRLQLVKPSIPFVNEGDPNMRIWKVFVNETGYLYQAHTRQSEGSPEIEPTNKEEL